MSWTTNPSAQRDDVDAWLRGITDCLTPKTIELLLFLIIIIILRRFLTRDSSQNHNHVELTKITCSLSNAFTAQLKLSDKHITHLQEELTRAQSRIDKLEVKVQDNFKCQTTEFLRELMHTQHCTDQLKAKAQDKLKVPDEAEQETKKQVDKLQEALAVTERDKLELKTVQKHLVNQLQSAEHQLEKATADIKDKNSEINALKDHLERCSAEMDHLTQQRDDANDELYAVRDELQHIFQQKPEPRRERPPSASPLLSRTESSIQELPYNGRSEWPQPKTSPAFTTELFPANKRRELTQTDSKAAQGMTFKDLNQLVKNITQFNPNSTEGPDIQTYIRDINFHLEVRPHMTDRDRFYLLRSTSSPEVRSFLDRQPAHVKSNYQLLCETLIKEFTGPESEHGVLIAMETKQGRQETPQAYYYRFRQAYLGAHNKPELEEDVNFKTLFLRNLHPGLSHHLGIMACPGTMTIQQLRDLTHKAYIKQKMNSKKGLKTSTVSNSISQDTSLALEDTQWHDNTTVLRKEHRERDSHVADTYYTNRMEMPWDQPRFSSNPQEGNHWKPNWTSKGHQPRHPKALHVGTQQRNPPWHHSVKHSTEYAQEPDSLPSEDTEQLMRQLKVFIGNEVNMDDEQDGDGTEDHRFI
ncbi:uncharacterized protein LOC130097298 [Rhinichthys klamathensis goyatoka]|uniref:uncharacterized protein LOC130097298 n=1 Tax=Rhinichthys klamathensis goyatoka TaxID=3034132 RepID=UPI0024B6033B|nr:uncharacterized protein LOC130097298 [Rhinichthys klamathensis goyatoka]